MERKQIKTICIYREVKGDGVNEIPVRFSQDIHLPFPVNYLESVVEFSTGDAPENATYSNGCLYTNLIPNPPLAVASSVGFESKHTLRNMTFNGLYDFQINGPDNGPILLPVTNPETNAYVLIQITFYE